MALKAAYHNGEKIIIFKRAGLMVTRCNNETVSLAFEIHKNNFFRDMCPSIRMNLDALVLKKLKHGLNTNILKHDIKKSNIWEGRSSHLSSTHLTK